MAKTKKNKKANSDAVYAKKAAGPANSNPFNSASSKKINPFEVHVNKEKFQILGRTCKHDKGLPGVSRAKAIKRRNETLGQEFRDKHKTNRFRDMRIGKNLSEAELSENIVNARFMAEKLSQVKQGKASRFNLDDNEVLTHRGQTLEEIEQYNDDRSDDEAMEDEVLNADFTEVAHFGGDATQIKDRNTAIEEMIIEQKRRKVEIAKEKNELYSMTEKLDSNYKELSAVMGKMSKSEMKVRPPVDDYDKIMREMIFEPRGVVTDKLMSEEELAAKEKERLEQLERERIQRMQGDGEIVAETVQPKHRSADDLDDGYFAVGEEEEEGTLAYRLDGELGTKIKHTADDEVVGEEAEFEAEEEGEEIDTGNSGDSSDEREDAIENDDSSVDDEEEEENEDNLSDLKVSDSEEEETAKALEIKGTKPQKESNSSAETKRTDLPFTIEMPDSYDNFAALLSKHTPEDQAIIVDRLIKCNHPKLDGVNKEKVVKLFAFLLQYINELFSDASQEDVALHFKILDRLNPHIYDLIHLNPEKMSTVLLKVLKQKYVEYCKNSKAIPSLETAVFFKLVSNYFSTSDYRHPVVTPCYIFLQHVLSKARVRTRQDIAMGMFLVTVALEFSQQSHRFIPAVFNYLLGIVHLSIPKRSIEVSKIVPPFVSSGPMSKLLAIGGDTDTSHIPEEKLRSEDLVLVTYSTDFKIRVLNSTLKLIKDAITIVSDNVGSNYLAEPLLEMLSRLPLDAYPEYVRINYNATEEALKLVAAKRLTKIVPPEKKPKALRLLEPRFEAVYDDKRRPKVSKEKEEKLKLLHKLKRETKGAVRELRRDTEYLQKIRIQQQIQSDLERKEKVKLIYQEAAVQQGELNELARAKKKKKF